MKILSIPAASNTTPARRDGIRKTPQICHAKQQYRGNAIPRKVTGIKDALERLQDHGESELHFQDHPELCLSAEHSSIGLGCFFQRISFDHGTYT